MYVCICVLCMCYTKSSLSPPWETFPNPPSVLWSPVPILKQWMLCSHSGLWGLACGLVSTYQDIYFLSSASKGSTFFYGTRLLQDLFLFSYLRMHPWPVARQGQQCADGLEGRGWERGILVSWCLHAVPCPIQTSTKACDKAQNGLTCVLGQ